jgi:hypothetical protein
MRAPFWCGCLDITVEVNAEMKIKLTDKRKTFERSARVTSEKTGFLAGKAENTWTRRPFSGQ